METINIPECRIPSLEHRVLIDWATAAEIELFIKRDDLIHPIISGNKWRKLKGHLNHFSPSDYDQICTYGGAFSNHLVATAAACASLQIPCIGKIRSYQNTLQNPILDLCQLYGMRLEFLIPNIYTNEKEISGISERILYIPEGGAGALGTIGTQEIITELEQTYDHVFVASGTGTTLAGMAKAMDHNATQLHGIQILKGEKYIQKVLAQNYQITQVHFHDNYHFGGYAKTTPELIHFVKDFAQQTGILLDPIYTGKMLFAIRDLALQNHFPKNQKILAIHTGGLTGWVGKWGDLSLYANTADTIF